MIEKDKHSFKGMFLCLTPQTCDQAELPVTHSLIARVSSRSILFLSDWLRHSFRPAIASHSSVMVPTETLASVAMENVWVSVRGIWTSLSNRLLD